MVNRGNSAAGSFGALELSRKRRPPGGSDRHSKGRASGVQKSGPKELFPFDVDIMAITVIPR